MKVQNKFRIENRSESLYRHNTIELKASLKASKVLVYILHLSRINMLAIKFKKMIQGLRTVNYLKRARWAFKASKRGELSWALKSKLKHIMKCIEQILRLRMTGKNNLFLKLLA